ncbi:Slam-dependent surface lipoprotein [Erwinia sp. B116]|uniref:Slam-dependent surface lipoprotein n=1 Tax=Erwinia sp. B116 TaxID=1561024 RepID=UPI000C78D88F|nr:Slam-dependent surface lipoprotein [Erwinia sp. B116]PLV63857.1 hypothetical protein NV64_01115 [Erwinia sp. B116]
MLNIKSTLLLSVIALTACGGGGGGGGGDSEPPVTTSPVQTDDNTSTTPALPTTPATSYASGGKLDGYTYTTPDGREYVMRGGGVFVSGVRNEILVRADNTRVTSTSWCCGSMSYTTFGTWTNYDTDKHEVFYTGEATATASVPTQGSASYTGTALRGTERGDASFNVVFASKTISGTLTPVEAGNFGSEVAMQGKISNGGFSGDAQSGGEKGTFIGHFMGPAAEELAGVAQFTDTSKNTAFGATKQ